MRFTIFPSSNLVIFVILFFLCLSPVFAASTDTLNPSQSLTFNQTLISAGAKFELGFFSRGNPKKYYAGIWYKDIPSDGIFLWVANRDSPSLNDSCILKLDDRANLVILDDGSHVRWNSSSDNSTAQNPVLQLLDSGNLVIREAEDQNPDHYIWQSFDHPTHTFIPGQKLGWNLVTGLNRFLTSWRAQDDPGSGNFTFKMDYHGDPEIYMRDGDQIIYRSGPWVGQRFSGEPEMATSNNGFTFTFHRGKKEVYYTYQLPPDGKVKSRVIITSQGKLERWTWVPNTSQWHIYWYATNDDCSSYKVCGSYGVCNTSATFNCQCPQGFEPDRTQGWAPNKLNGCVRKTKLGCQSDDFLKMANMKLPESTTAFLDSGLDLHHCRERCKKNCSCTAFANLDVVQGVGNGCVLWTDDLIDLRVYVQGGQDLYLRLAASDLAKYKKSKGLFANKKLEAVLITVAVLAFILVIFLLSYLLHKKKKREWEEEAERSLWTKDADETDASSDLPFFTRNEIAAATDNFNSTNKLGKGGFGSVYKGKMENGQEIAVKKLAPNSGQGIQEFKNEVRLIARLQHRNLVKIVGCCIKGEEKMLIYEFMPNKSLDYFIFNEEKRSYLDWTKRFDIIMGIARGMLYLHQDSRLRIIHRDLKTSNILLDKDMIPKISDFGTARIFGNEQVQVNTTRVVGTYGYMAPEYALEGLMSVKSDVFSFGVLLLEVITGRKNSGFYPDNPSINLVGHVWELWKEGRTLEIVDPFSKDEDNEKELLICLQIGLLCVQERADDRPTMSAVVFMLSNKVELPSPNRPAFIHRVKQSDADPSSSSPGAHSINELSVTAMVDGR